MSYILRIKYPDRERCENRFYKTWKGVWNARLRYEEKFMACCTIFEEMPRGFEQLSIFDEDEPPF